MPGRIEGSTDLVGGWWDGFRIAAAETLGWWGALILIVVLLVGAAIYEGLRRRRADEDTVEDEDFEYYKVLGPL